MRVMLLLLACVLAGQVQAGQAFATGSTARKASAQLDFKIVIQATLHLNSRDEQRRRSRQVISRTTEVRHDRIVVTVATF